MSIQTITAAQRLAIRDTAAKLARGAHFLAEDGSVPSDAYAALLLSLMQDLGSAIAVAGVIQVGTTQALVSQGQTATVVNSAGTSITVNGTLNVASGSLTNLALPANVAGVFNSGTASVPVTTTTAKTAGQTSTVAARFTVAAGVITAITIP